MRHLWGTAPRKYARGQELGNLGGSLIGIHAFNACSIDGSGDVIIGCGSGQAGIGVRQLRDERGVDLEVGAAVGRASIDVVPGYDRSAGLPSELRGRGGRHGGEVDAGNIGAIDRKVLDVWREGIAGVDGCDGVGSVGKAGETVIAGTVGGGGGRAGAAQGNACAITGRGRANVAGNTEVARRIRTRKDRASAARENQE